MPLATTLPLNHILFELVFALMLVGIALILWAPRIPGLAVILAGVLIYVGYASAIAKTLAGISPGGLIGVVALALIGLSAPYWTDKLGFRRAYVTQTVAYGAMVGSFIGIIIFGLYGMLIGIVVGAMLMEIRDSRSPADGLRQGIASLVAMMGPRGFQLLMALLTASLALSTLSEVLPGGPL